MHALDHNLLKINSLLLRVRVKPLQSSGKLW